MSGNPSLGLSEGDVGAEHWFARLRAPDCTPADRSAFEQWKADPAHAADYRDVERVFEQSLTLQSDPLVAAATRAALRSRATRPSMLGLRRLAMPVVGLFAVVAVAWFVRPMLVTPRVAEAHYSTRVGERLSIVLADGSTVLLDTASSVAARVGAGERSVRLIAGQAQFQVIHNDKIPFTVNVGNGTIRDIGTQFSVRTEDSRVTVTVTEGAVSVSDSNPDGARQRSDQLQPGEQLVFSETGELWEKRSVDLKMAGGWITGDLAFADESLGAVVHEMNRYTTAQIRVGDPRLDELRVSGVFHAGDQQSFLLALQKGWSVRWEQDSSSHIALFPQ
jgi:transmembrane sensor